MIWTHTDREKWIFDCIHKFKIKNQNYQCKYLKKNDIITSDENELLKSEIQEKIISIFCDTELYNDLLLNFYNKLKNKICSNSYLKSNYENNNLKIVIKGGTSYAFHLNSIPLSDLDIIIYINPLLPTNIFNKIYFYCEQILLQCISKHKQFLDEQFIYNQNDEMSNITICKKKHIETLHHLQIQSCFENNNIRNLCSRNSFLIENCKSNNKVAQIEIPHYTHCEKIPLKKTPFFCSVNKSIRYCEANDEICRSFDLYRLRMNNCKKELNNNEISLLFNVTDENNIKVNIQHKIMMKQIATDLIDISILHQNDTELLDAVNTYDFINIKDNSITIPSIKSCILDINKMLNVYASNESKKEKRREILKHLEYLL